MTNTIASYSADEWYAQVPRRINKIAIFGIGLMALAFGGFGTWAFRAPLASAVIAQGTFVATGQNKVVQHLEGGIIDRISVEEGEEVFLGQTIMMLDRTAAQTGLTELTQRRQRLQAINARLLAEYNGQERITFPKHLLDDIGNPKVADILQNQRTNFAVSRAKLENDIGLITANITALHQRINGYELQKASLDTQISILNEDHAAKSKLHEQGLVRKPEVNNLMRALAEGEGQMARIGAEIEESTTMIGKYEHQIEQTIQAYRQAALDEIQAVQAELDTVIEQAQQAEDVLKRTRIYSPVSGTVLRLHYHTSGGVVESGKSIAEILPRGAPLVIETLVPRTEIDSVTVGHPASVRLVALNQRTTPVLNGHVEYVSADAVPDTTTGERREVYVARISMSQDELKRVDEFNPIPGMPAEILIKTRDRTFFQYITKPITDSMSRAFRED
jgi:HlyD family secretion protein